MAGYSASTVNFDICEILIILSNNVNLIEYQRIEILVMRGCRTCWLH